MLRSVSLCVLARYEIFVTFLDGRQAQARGNSVGHESRETPHRGATYLQVWGGCAAIDWHIAAHISAPFSDRFRRDDDFPGEQQLFDIAKAQAEAEIQPDAVADDFSREVVGLIAVSGGCVHAPSMAHSPEAV